jgi:hypothetical protein
VAELSYFHAQGERQALACGNIANKCQVDFNLVNLLRFINYGGKTSFESIEKLYGEHKKLSEKKNKNNNNQ